MSKLTGIPNMLTFLQSQSTGYKNVVPQKLARSAYRHVHVDGIKCIIYPVYPSTSLSSHCYSLSSHCYSPSHCYSLPSHCYSPPSHCYSPPSHCYSPPSHCYSLPSHFLPILLILFNQLKFFELLQYVSMYRRIGLHIYTGCCATPFTTWNVYA